MNPVVVVHLFAAALAISLAIPLIRRRVKMNPWYGVRIPAAFASEASWFEINRHGGWLLLAWGAALAATAAVGAFLPRRDWVAYDWTALAVVMVGLAAVIGLILRRARKA